MPVAKETDAEVFAGTINGDGALEIESTKAAEDTTLARIIRMVQEAHGRRAQVEQWVEKFPPSTPLPLSPWPWPSSWCPRDRTSTHLNSSPYCASRMPSSA